MTDLREQSIDPLWASVQVSFPGHGRESIREPIQWDRLEAQARALAKGERRNRDG